MMYFVSGGIVMYWLSVVVLISFVIVLGILVGIIDMVGIMFVESCIFG